MDQHKKQIIGRSAAVVLLLFLFLAGIAFVFVAKALKPKQGELTGSSGPLGVVQAAAEMREIALHPTEGFPGQDRIIILGMGIDDNWTNKDEVYTKNARTDTLFLLTLDIVNKTATMLSIPRDTYTHIAGTDTTSKINGAYASGGPQRAIATVNELLGVHADHYLVLNIDATRKMVDALGGVDVNVEHEMHYHDKWGHLNIDLMPGQQHLNGEQAVGFARYRHPDAHAKSSPEDGDERRMARQHVLLRSMVATAKTFANGLQANHLIDVAMSCIQTDLTRTQLFDLAAIFHGIQPQDIQTASLPGEDFHTKDGAWDYRIYPEKAKAYVGWLVNGDDKASHALVPVVVRNPTTVSGLARYAADQLREDGFTDVRVDSNLTPRRPRLAASSLDNAPKSGPLRTEILDTGVVNPNAPAEIATTLHINSPDSKRVPVMPNHLGWKPPVSVTLTLGQDYADRVKSSGEMDNAASHGNDDSSAPVSHRNDDSNPPVSHRNDDSSALASQGNDDSSAPASHGNNASRAPASHGNNGSSAPASRENVDSSTPASPDSNTAAPSPP